MAKFPESAQMERRGIMHLAATCSELGHIWRETPNSDVGFDGEIELVTGRSATAHIIKVQVRAGTSYLRNEKPDRFDYYGDANEFEYWQESTNPVLLIIFDPRTDSAFWLDVKNYLRTHPEAVTQRPHKITFLKEQQSKMLSTEGLELLFGPDYNVLTDRYRRHVIERFSKLTIYSVNSDSPLAVDLERVFITVKTTRRSMRSFDFDVGTDPILPVAVLEAAKTIQDRAKTNLPEIEHYRPKSTYFSDLPVNRITIGEALCRSRNAVIIGSPGAGKTTLLKYLALTFARIHAEEEFGITESLVPLFITLRDFSRFLDNADQRGELLDLSPKLLPDFITVHLRSVAPHLNLPVEFFTHYLESSKCIVLLDGLDEVAEPLKRMRVAEVIDSFTQQYQGNRFVITSRPRGYEGEARQRLSAQYPDWMIQDFDDADMEKFTSSWYEAVTRDRLGDSTEAIAEARTKADDLLRAIRADQRVAVLAHNPLLLSVLAMVHQRGVGLPQRRAELYDECTDLLLGYWDQTKGGEAARELAQYGELDRTEKRTLLEPIALWFHERGQQNLEADKKELRQKIADQFQASFVDQNHVAQKRADLFLRVIDERAGLLVEREVSVYSFAHLTFQEYLAARSIADSENYIEYTLQRLHDDWWREVILLEIGHLSDVRHFGRRGRKLTTELIRRIREAGSPLEAVLRRDFFFVARAMADIGPLGVDDELRQSVFKELIELWQSTPFELQRREAVDIFGYILPTSEGPRIRTAIISLLDHKDPQKTILAMQAIMQLGVAVADETVTSHVLALTYNSSPAVRSMAATCVEKIGGISLAEAVTTRILALSQDADPMVRFTAAGHLLSVGKVGMRGEIVDSLLRLAADDDPLIRKVAGSAIERILQTRSRKIIKRKLIELTRNPQPSVRTSGALTLAQIVRFKPTIDLIRQLLILTTDDDEHVRGVAQDSFDEILNGPMQGVLRERLLELSHDSVMRKAAQTILKRLKTESFSINALVDTVLGSQLYRSNAEEQFLQLSNSSDRDTRLGALSLLRSISWYEEPTDLLPKHISPFDPLHNQLVNRWRRLKTTTSPELENRVQAHLLNLLSDDDIAIRVKAAVCYRERLDLHYQNVSLNLLIKFWLNHVTSTESVPGGEQAARVCDIGYGELKLLAKILPEARPDETI